MPAAPYSPDENVIFQDGLLVMAMKCRKKDMEKKATTPVGITEWKTFGVGGVEDGLITQWLLHGMSQLLEQN